MERINGSVSVNIFYNSTNQFNISKIKTSNGTETISGYFPLLEKNINYDFMGEYVVHKKYGRQFSVKSYKIHVEETKEALISYLTSDLFKGIGLISANKIYDLLGDNLIEKIKENKEVLSPVLNNEKKELVYNVIVSNEILNDILLTLYDYGLSTVMAMKLYNKYFDSTLEIIKQNPYRLINEVDGFGFVKCDELALKLGFSKTCELRIQNVILYIIGKLCFNNGNTYVVENQLIDECLYFFNNEIDVNILKNNLEILKKDSIVCIDNNIFLKEIYYSEMGIASKLLVLKDNKEYKKSKYEKYIDIVEQHNEIEYTNSQKEAILEALCNPVCVITGCPGTGKTTVIKAILDIYQYINGVNLNEVRDVLLLAPTGKAAKRMFELTGIRSSTIHKALGYTYEGGFTFNEDNQLYAKMIIVDEVSMIDVFLGNNLLKAIKNNTKLILVGDQNQIPSINPGNVLADIISSNTIKVVNLVDIHRQSLDSGIVALSKMIMNNNIDDIIYEYGDVRGMDADNYDVFTCIMNAVNESLGLGYLFKDIIILAPLYKGNAGIDMINTFMQETYNPGDDFITHNGRKFKENDKVIQLVNNPDKGIMNGETGTIKNIIKTKDETVVTVEYDAGNIRYIKAELDEISLAYALSIHKSQGSEYKVVIMPILTNYYVMLKKKLIYTGITRAKERLYIIGNRELLKCTYNNDIKARKTNLVNLLNGKNSYSDDFDFEIEEDNITPYDFM